MAWMSCLRGPAGAYGFGLARTDSEGLHRAFDGVRFDSGPRFNLDIGAFAQATAFAALIERAGVEVASVDVAFGLDPLGAQARAGAAAEVSAVAPIVAELRGRGFRGPFVAADARAVHDAGGTPAQELAFALAAGVAYLRALETPEAIEFRLAADADAIRDAGEIPGDAAAVGARPVRLRRRRRAGPGARRSAPGG